MAAVMETPFNEAQVEILKLFSTGLTNNQLKELRQTLIAFKFKLLDEHVERVITKKGLTEEDIENASFAHRRTPYWGKKQQNEPLNNKILV